MGSHLPTLLDALKSILADLSSPNPTSQVDNSQLANQQELSLWLLDRLLPQSDGGFFEQQLGTERGIYAWGRRLTPERRKEILDLSLPPAPADQWNRRMVWQALVFAWCDSCPDDQLRSLLSELALWSRKLERGEGWYLGDLIEEFYRRCADARVRGEELRSFLQRLLRSQKTGTPYDYADQLAWRCWIRLLQDAAQANRGDDPLPQSEEEWNKYFDRTMSLPPFSPVAELGHELIATGANLKSNAKSLWIWRHGKDEWEKLYFQSGIFVSDFYNSASILNRLAEIVPAERLDIWDGFVMNDSGFERIHAFCRWLPAKYAEVLRDQFNNPDRDWAACAYQNYLAKTYEPILHHYFKLFDDLPGWQLKLLDRRLYAPELVRPSPLLEDMQTVEGDLRLQDPFNHRGY
jgi:hypothetical protein